MIAVAACDSVSSITATDAVDVMYKFNLETATADGLQIAADKVSEELVSAIASDHCPKQRQRRRLEIASAEIGASAEPLGPCAGSSSPTCTEFLGSVSVAFTNEGANSLPETVTAGVLGSIKTTLNDPTTTDDVNVALTGTGATVVGLSYAGEPGNSAPPPPPPLVKDKGGLTSLGITMVAFVALLVLLILLLCCCFVRGMTRRRSGKNKSYPDDSKSTNYDTDASSTIGAENLGEPQEFSSLNLELEHDLGARHSGLDVQKCNNPSCAACNPFLRTAPAATNLLEMPNPSPPRRAHRNEESGLMNRSNGQDEENVDITEEEREVMVVQRNIDHRLGRVHRQTGVEPQGVRFFRVKNPPSIKIVGAAAVEEHEQLDL